MDDYPDLSTYLSGEDDANIDEKGRLMLRKDKRDFLGSKFCITLGPGGYLILLSAKAWKEMADRILNEDRLNPGRKTLARDFFPNSEKEVVLDGQGRFIVPPNLRAKAGLGKEVTVCGCGDSIEIWDRERAKTRGRDDDRFFVAESEYENAFLRMNGEWPKLPPQ